MFAVMGRLCRKMITQTFRERTRCRQYFFLRRGFSAKLRGVWICAHLHAHGRGGKRSATAPPPPGVYEEVSAGAATETLFVEAAACRASRERRRRFSWTERGASGPSDCPFTLPAISRAARGASVTCANHTIWIISVTKYLRGCDETCANLT